MNEDHVHNGNDNVHNGHRERMRNRYITDGPDSFADHELLEMILYGLIPREDTNPLAHRLLEKYGTIANLLESDAAEIAKVPGMGSAGAVFLSQIHEMVRRYERGKISKKPQLTTVGLCADYCRKLLHRCPTEKFYMICLDSCRRVIYVAKLANGTVENTNVPLRLVAETALRYKSTGVVFCHNHPNGHVLPSGPDVSTTASFKKTLDAIGVTVVDHIIIGDNGKYFSFFGNGLIKSIDRGEAIF